MIIEVMLGDHPNPATMNYRYSNSYKLWNWDIYFINDEDNRVEVTYDLFIAHINQIVNHRYPKVILYKFRNMLDDELKVELLLKGMDAEWWEDYI